MPHAEHDAIRALCDGSEVACACRGRAVADAAERRRQPFAPPAPVAPTEPSRPEPHRGPALPRDLRRTVQLPRKAESEEDAEGSESFQQQPAELSNAGPGGARGRPAPEPHRPRADVEDDQDAGRRRDFAPDHADAAALDPRQPAQQPSESPQVPRARRRDPQALALSTVAEMSSSASCPSESGRLSSMVQGEVELGLGRSSDTKAGREGRGADDGVSIECARGGDHGGDAVYE